MTHLDLLPDLLARLSPAYYVEQAAFKPYDWQRRLLNSRSKRRLVNGARQSGKSITVASLPCWAARHFPGKLSIIAAATEKQAIEDLNRIKSWASKDPKLKATRSSDELLEFENGSRILVVTASEKSVRGWTRPILVLLDEASLIPDNVYVAMRPWLNNNPDCTLVVISTPNGREGFFYRAWLSERWERYEIRAPWDLDDLAWELTPAVKTEEEFRAEKAKVGIYACYSPEHLDRVQQTEDLLEMGSARMFRQEYLVEFVEPEGAAFRYADIEAMMGNRIETDLGGGATIESELEAFAFDE